MILGSIWGWARWLLMAVQSAWRGRLRTAPHMPCIDTFKHKRDKRWPFHIPSQRNTANNLTPSMYPEPLHHCFAYSYFMPGLHIYLGGCEC